MSAVSRQQLVVSGANADVQAAAATKDPLSGHPGHLYVSLELLPS